MYCDSNSTSIAPNGPSNNEPGLVQKIAWQQAITWTNAGLEYKYIWEVRIDNMLCMLGHNKRNYFFITIVLQESLTYIVCFVFPWLYINISSCSGTTFQHMNMLY